VTSVVLILFTPLILSLLSNTRSLTYLPSSRCFQYLGCTTIFLVFKDERSCLIYPGVAPFGLLMVEWDVLGSSGRSFLALPERTESNTKWSIILAKSIVSEFHLVSSRLPVNKGGVLITYKFLFDSCREWPVAGMPWHGFQLRCMKSSDWTGAITFALGHLAIIDMATTNTPAESDALPRTMDEVKQSCDR